LLVLALPASGKSELRRYLASVDMNVARRDFGLGPTVDLDDYPYVHLMRRLDEELDAMGTERVFYPSSQDPFQDGRDWATLIHLLNEDHAALGSHPEAPTEPTRWLLDRIGLARSSVGIDPALPAWTASMRAALAARLDDEVESFAEQRARTLATFEAGQSTVVVEFARGGSAGAELPLPPPHGYRYSMAALSAELLRSARVLYVWVTPEESRRRNRDRAMPGRDGDASILHHGVPERVMRHDYGTDDFLWLLDRGGGAAVSVPNEDGVVTVPAAVFDNRVDRTSFLRAAVVEWEPAAVADLHQRLAEAFAVLR